MLFDSRFSLKSRQVMNPHSSVTANKDHLPVDWILHAVPRLNFRLYHFPHVGICSVGEMAQ